MWGSYELLLRRDACLGAGHRYRYDESACDVRECAKLALEYGLVGREVALGYSGL